LHLFRFARLNSLENSRLRYKNHQIMLVDRKGLGSAEITDEKLSVLQRNLVSALNSLAQGSDLERNRGNQRK
jgi:hypothetical protein